MEINREKIHNALIVVLFLVGSFLMLGDFNANSQKELTVEQMADKQKDFFVSEEFNNNKKKYIPTYGEAQKEREYLEDRLKFN